MPILDLKKLKKKKKKKKHKKDILCKMVIQGAFIDDSHKVWIKSDR